MRTRAAALLLVCCACTAGACDRDQSELRGAYPAAGSSRQVVTTPLQPGAPHTPQLATDYREDSVAVWEGMRLFNWYNCNGCHLNGGGGIGPPLADDKWIYGYDPLQILASIIEGRADGMPSYAGRISSGEALRIVAYVRSLAGLTERRLDMWPVLGQHMRGPPEFAGTRRDELQQPAVPMRY